MALVKIEPGQQIPFSRIVPQSYVFKVNYHVRVLGCAEGQNPTMFETRITDAEASGPSPLYVGIQCEKRPKQGRSGGGLFTDDGYLLGVTDFAEQNESRGLYAHPRSIYAVLADAGMNDLYVSNGVRVVDSPKGTRVEVAWVRSAPSWIRRQKRRSSNCSSGGARNSRRQWVRKARLGHKEFLVCPENLVSRDFQGRPALLARKVLRDLPTHQPRPPPQLP